MDTHPQDAEMSDSETPSPPSSPKSTSAVSIAPSSPNIRVRNTRSVDLQDPMNPASLSIDDPFFPAYHAGIVNEKTKAERTAFLTRMRALLDENSISQADYDRLLRGFRAKQYDDEKMRADQPFEAADLEDDRAAIRASVRAKMIERMRTYELAKSSEEQVEFEIEREEKVREKEEEEGEGDSDSADDLDDATKQEIAEAEARRARRERKLIKAKFKADPKGAAIQDPRNVSFRVDEDGDVEVVYERRRSVGAIGAEDESDSEEDAENDAERDGEEVDGKSEIGSGGNSLYVRSRNNSIAVGLDGLKMRSRSNTLASTVASSVRPDTPSTPTSPTTPGFGRMMFYDNSAAEARRYHQHGGD